MAKILGKIKYIKYISIHGTYLIHTLELFELNYDSNLHHILSDLSDYLQRMKNLD